MGIGVIHVRIIESFSAQSQYDTEAEIDTQDLGTGAIGHGCVEIARNLVVYVGKLTPCNPVLHSPMISTY